MSNKKNKPLMPKLRFPAFRNSPEWISEKVDRLVDTITPPKKLPTSSYAVNGDFPIIDQSQNAICGWTDDREALIKDDLPLIIFGDHTCILKLLDRPFAQGADGIKILKPRPRIGTSYLYQYLSYRPVVTEEYKRHYSILKEKVVLFPDFKTGEQQKIADCLSSLDELIVAQARKVNALKTHKKGLMQQLFPREGETQPRLRFPEFQSTGVWRTRKVSSLLTRSVSPVSVESEGVYREIGIRSHGKGIFHKEPLLGKELGDKRVFHVEESAFVLNIVFAWEQAVAVTSAAERGMIASHRFPIYKPNECEADVDFIKYFFLTNKGKELLGIASPGGAGRNKTLGQKEFEKLEFLCPRKVEEQTAIARCLSSTDDLITIAAQELETLKTQKKGLMQQLFPSPEVVEA
jgi:type I restriction enzyme S subunit